MIYDNSIDDYKFKISATDTTPDYAFNKLVAVDGITILKGGQGANETLRFYNTKKNLISFLPSDQVYLNEQTTPTGEQPITDYVKLGDPSNTGTTAFKNILLSGKQYYIDIKILVEALEEGRYFDIKINGDNSLWATEMTIERGLNVYFTETNYTTILTENTKYIGIDGQQRFYIADNPAVMSTIRITGYIATQTAEDTELSISVRNSETISADDEAPITILKSSIIHSTLCNF
jgi:hypothetical protein